MTGNWCRIQPALQCDQLPDCTVYALHVRGTAFLWHQVCIFYRSAFASKFHFHGYLVQVRVATCHVNPDAQQPL